MKLNTGTVAAIATSCGFASTAFARQQPPEQVTEATSSSVIESVGPQNVPGRPKRDEPKAPEAPAEPREWFGGKPWPEWSRITGDWAGARTKLENAGLSLSASFTLDWSTVLSGGIEKVASSRTLLDINANVDLEKIVGLAGGSVFADFYVSDGRGGSEDAGDFGGVSSIGTGDNTQQLAELWYQQELFDKKLRIKVGKIDANTDFAYFNCTGDFMNSPCGYPVTMYPVFTAYPNPATGIDVFFYPIEHLFIGGGFFDGSAAKGKPLGRLGPASFFHGDAYFMVAECGGDWKCDMGTGRAAAGLWHHTADFDAFDGSTKNGTSGFYILGEQQVWKRSAAEEDADKGLFVFGEYGFADEDVNAAGNHLGAGLSLVGTFPGRDDDAAGFMVNWIDMSDATGAGFSGDEVAFELFYKFQLTPAISLTPDIQWISNPSGDPSTSDALVAGIRFLVNF